MSDEEFRQQFQRNKPSSSDELIFYCRSGRRSTEALDKALKLGYAKYCWFIIIRNDFMSFHLCTSYMDKVIFNIFFHFAALKHIWEVGMIGQADRNDALLLGAGCAIKLWCIVHCSCIINLHNKIVLFMTLFHFVCNFLMFYRSCNMQSQGNLRK